MNKLIISISSLLFTAGCVPTSVMEGKSRTETVHVVIDANTEKKRINPLIFGSNVQWENRGDGVLESFNDSGEVIFNEPLLAKIKAVKPTLLRYPGGSLADTYDWKKGVGVFADRGENLTFGGLKEKTIFGLDEFMKFCHEINCTPIYTINFNMTPEEARELVEYANGSVSSDQGQKRAQNGSREPYNIRYWEVGNEIYSAGEEGHTTAENYADKYLQFYSVMKKADPDIEIGACFELAFQSAAWMEKKYPHILSWNKKLAPQIEDSLDFLSVHFYTPYDFKSNDSTMAKTVLASVQTFEDDLVKLQALFTKQKPVIVTEYNVYYEAANFKKVATLQGGLFNASMLISFIENGIDGACHWSLANNGYFGLLRSETFLVERPSYKVFKLMREHIHDVVVSTEVETLPTYKVNAFGNVPASWRIDQLDLLATSDDSGESVSLIAINKSPDEPVLISVSLKGFSLEPEVKVSEIASSDTWADNEVITFVNQKDTLVQLQDSLLRYSLKTNSITAFKFQKSN